MPQNTSKAPALQAFASPAVAQPFAGRHLLAVALLLALCLAILLAAAISATQWSVALPHVTSALAQIPHSWGCGGTSTAC